MIYSKNRYVYVAVVAIITLVLSGGYWAKKQTLCVQVGPEIAQICEEPACGKPVNLSIAKERVQKYYEGGQYDRDMNAVIDQAMTHFSHQTPSEHDVVIFDIDDTLLSYYADGKDIKFGFIPELFHEWVMQADAPAIKQTKKLYDYLVSRGYHIIFMTGRKSDEYDATIQNLRQQGFTIFDKLIVRSEPERFLPAKEYKVKRREKLVQDGYTIAGTIGDQWSDHEGGYTSYIVKLPNFQYLLP